VRLRIIATGGTFDKEYNELTGELFFHTSHLEDMLKLGRCTLPVTVETLMMVDSLSMGSAERAAVLRRCLEVEEERIVITHGTDTMVETGRHLAGRLSGKTVVLTGAMVPYTFGSSDGLFNLGSALAYAQAMPEGVYVVMNGRIFNWDNVRKNRSIGRFEELT
jgi:L-asparaginase